MRIKLIASCVVLAAFSVPAQAEVVAVPVESTKAASPTAVPLRGIEEEVWHTIQDWAAAWSARDSFSFLAFYSKDFKPEDGSTFDDWSRRRRVYFRQIKLVDVSVAFPALRILDDKHAKVRFTQSVKAGQVQSLDEKSMTLVKIGGLWMITEEESLSSRVDPIASTRVASASQLETAVQQTPPSAVVAGQPLAVSPLASTPLPTSGNVEPTVGEVTQFVQEWAKAWSSRQANYFFAFYGPRFRPNDGSSLDAWQKRRRDHFQRVKSIDVDVSEQSVEFSGKNRAEIRFTQTFRADKFNEVSRKLLVLERVGDSWKIAAEKPDPRLAEYQLAKIEAVRAEAARVEAAKAAAAKIEADKAAAAKAEAAKVEAAKAEARKVEAARLVAAKAEADAAKAAAARVAAEQAEAAKVEARKAEAARVEAARVAAAKAESDKAEAARVAASHAEVAHVQASTPVSSGATIADPAKLGLEAWGAVQAWIHDWSALDANAFLAHYGAAFLPEDGSTRAAWEERRREYFKRVKFIEVGLEHPVIKLQDDSHVEIQFDQAFRSDIYREGSKRKWLTLEKVEGQWKIVAEQSDAAAHAKLESAQSAKAKAESAKQEQAKKELARAEALKAKAEAEQAQAAALKLEQAKADAARAESARVKAESDKAKAAAEKAKAESDKAKAQAAAEDAKAKAEAARNEVARAEALKAEAAQAKADAAKAKAEANAEVALAKAEVVKAEQAKVEAARAEAAKAKAEAVRAKAEADAQAARSKVAEAKVASPVAIVAKPDLAQASPTRQVEEGIAAWAKAWAARDIDAYLASYGEHFQPAGGESFTTWEAQRRARIGKAKTIEVGIEGLSVELLDGGYAKARFTQRYRSDNYRDVVSKMLILETTANGWRIVREESGTVGKPASAR